MACNAVSNAGDDVGLDTLFDADNAPNDDGERIIGGRGPHLYSRTLREMAKTIPTLSNVISLKK
ncbi:hypothetical protein HDU67_009649, partial [Dinochytrium kinnereticum]